MTLDLVWNELGDRGAEHLADGLRQNQVRDLSASILRHHVVSLHRH